MGQQSGLLGGLINVGSNPQARQAAAQKLEQQQAETAAPEANAQLPPSTPVETAADSAQPAATGIAGLIEQGKISMGRPDANVNLYDAYKYIFGDKRKK